MYMPWIHHIYIVTNNQVPKWLKQHEKITIVDHSEILPETARPCFNSQALECCLHKIPNIAEHFIYANDDTFVGRELSPSFFFLSSVFTIYFPQQLSLLRQVSLFPDR